MVYQSQSRITQNTVSWTGLVDLIYVDQPGMVIFPMTLISISCLTITVGVGFSTSESDGYSTSFHIYFAFGTHRAFLCGIVNNEDDMGADFVGGLFYP